jgi:TetR/AcrR family transcriptional repressor of mexJK operon
MPEQSLNRSEKTRAAIIRSAHDLFANQGYHGTSMRQIAGDAGIALGGLYNHFESKEKVFEAVVLESHPYQEIIPALLEARGETIEQFLGDAFRRMVLVLNEHPQFLKLMFIEIVEFRSAHAEKLFANLMPTLESIIYSIINSYQTSLSPIPPFIFLRYFLGFFFSYLLTNLFFSNESTSNLGEDVVDQYVSIFLHGILRENQPSDDLAGNLLTQ